MNIKLDDLQTMVRELTETYFGTSSAQSGLSSTAFNKVGPEGESQGRDIPVDKNDLRDQVRALIGGDAGFPLGSEWGDEVLNQAAAAAADALINGYDAEQKRMSTRMYEEIIQEEIKNFINENELDSKAVIDIFNKMVKLLDSVDMSLDLIYGAVSGADAPIAATRFKQRQLGRHVTPPKIKPSEG